jgi:hypothetical protein
MGVVAGGLGMRVIREKSGEMSISWYCIICTTQGAHMGYRVTHQASEHEKTPDSRI